EPIDYVNINDAEANIEEPDYVNTNYTEVNIEENNLFKGKKFLNWTVYGDIVRRRTYICKHRKKYEANTKQQTHTKKISCSWHLNASSPSSNNDKIFNQDILDDIKFMTEHCNMDATAQKKFLEGKYPLQPIYSKDLYAAIRKFRPTKALLNDAATISNWIDEQKKKDSRWMVARDWDDDNTLTRLFWMTPRLLIDETHESHVWLFNEIVKATGMEPAVIQTNSDPAADSAVKEVFKSMYPIHCAFHITQNLHKNLQKSLDIQYNQFLTDFYKCQNSLVKATFENKFTKLVHDYPRAKPYLDNLYKSKEYWAHSYTSFKFTEGMIATSRVEATNACLKKFLCNSNVSLNKLMQEIYHMLDRQDKESEYQFWKLAIPFIKNKCCQTYLTPNMLKMQKDEINKSVYYSAQQISIESLKSINEDNTMINIKEDNPEDQYATIQQMLEVVDEKNIVQAWLIQVMLNTNAAKFHIRLIPSRWYYKNMNASQETFITADKYKSEEAPDYAVPYLSPFYNQEKDFLQENLSLLKQKLTYRTLHGIYKKAISKALWSKSESDCLLKLLEDFVQECDQLKDSSSDDNHSDESISKEEFQLKNPKRRQGRGRPPGTKRIKASHETSQSGTTKQKRSCKKCGGIGHYQKNCTV
ncbi:9010_t:CDS:2, partial [Racocetra fulgida]